MTEELRVAVRDALFEFVDAGCKRALPAEALLARLKSITQSAGWYQVDGYGWSHSDGEPGDLLEVNLVRLLIQRYFSRS